MSDYQFVDADTSAVVADLIAKYESMTGQTLHPASPDRLFVMWAASAIVQLKNDINRAANQNLPSRASEENLDELGELFFTKTRPEAKSASCTVRFHISEAQTSSVLIPSGTRITDASSTLFWQTVADIYIPIGGAFADATVLCQTAGASGNGYVVGQLNTLVDLFPYYDHCGNLTASDGGADAATDAEFYQLMRMSEDARSTAGPGGAYIYWAKSVSNEIADVKAILPNDANTGAPMGGRVHIYALMNDGTIASPTIKERIAAACSDDEVRPLTDFVSVEDPTVIPYDIDLTYYIPIDTKQSAVEVEEAVSSAIGEYKAWQSGRLGRDINPSKLAQLLMSTGIKRVDITTPTFRKLGDGSNHTAPEIAQAGTVRIINGGYEHE